MTRPAAILAALFALLVLAVERPCSAASAGNSAGGSTDDALAVAVERYAGKGADYQRRIDEYLAARAAGKSFSAAQQRSYSNAFVHSGYAFYQRGDARSAEQRFRQAAAVDPTSPLPRYCLGVLYKKFSMFAPAVEHLRAAARLGGPLRTSCRDRLSEIVRALDEQGKALMQRGSYIAAARCYHFLADTFTGKIREAALKRLKAVEDEVAAERLLVEARRQYARGRRDDGRKLLKQLTTTYSWTRAAETAKRMLRGDDSLEVRVKSRSPAGKWAAREKWIDLETANCVVYYKNTKYAKVVAKRVEDTLQRVTEQLQYTRLDWHKDKCKVFVFDDAKAWAEFVEESGTTTEWASGFAYPPLREVYMHAGDPDDMLNRVLPHELTHVIHREYADRDAYLPLWLLEGLACYNEFTGKEQRLGLVKSALTSGRLIPLEHLTAFETYPRGEEVVDLFYAESLALVEFIIERFGHDGLVRLHKKLKSVDEFDKLVKRTFKMDVEEFERQWLEYIRTGK
jgi:tetratricopeptide (TPR) repeat protein